MDEMQPVEVEVSGPPDTRGPTAPLPAGVLTAGALALTAVVGGTVLLQFGVAITGGSLTSYCQQQRLIYKRIIGARGVCNVFDTLRGAPESVLLWGGLGLGLIAAVIGFVAAGKMDSVRKREEAIAGAVLGTLAVLSAILLLWFRAGSLVLTFAKQFLNFTLLKGSFWQFVDAARLTLTLAVGGELGGIVVGIILALFTVSSRRVVRAPARAYINFFRGTPLLWQLSVFYFGFSLGLGLNLGTIATALVVFSLNTGAYAAEVFRAGIQSVERGQIEAARSLGMTYLQAMRYAIIPQAVRRVIPPLMNEFVILIKDTSLIFVLGLVIGHEDLFSFAQDGYSNTYSATWFVGAAIGYLAITLPLIGLVNALERRLRSGLVGVAGAGL
jgi:His/Glu/Gln/Arg/opine family amino acid ABC transporter permease subunit